MPDALDDVLRLVAEGRLTAAEAAPIIAALETADEEPEREPAGTKGRAGRAFPWQRGSGPGDAGRSAAQGGRSVRLEVTEGGRTVVNLRLPAGLGEAAMLRVPGLSPAQVERIRGALADGLRGTLLEAGEDGDGVRSSIDSPAGGRIYPVAGSSSGSNRAVVPPACQNTTVSPSSSPRRAISMSPANAFAV